MTKKDYIAVANASNHITAVFRIDNSNFDNDRFYSYLESNKRYKDFTDK